MDVLFMRQGAHLVGSASSAHERDKLIGTASAEFIMGSGAQSHKNRLDT